MSNPQAPWRVEGGPSKRELLARGGGMLKGTLGSGEILARDPGRLKGARGSEELLVRISMIESGNSGRLKELQGQGFQ